MAGAARLYARLQPGNAVEQDHHVVTQLDETFRSLDSQLGNGGVVFGRPVEGR